LKVSNRSAITNAEDRDDDEASAFTKLKSLPHKDISIQNGRAAASGDMTDAESDEEVPILLASRSNGAHVRVEVNISGVDIMDEPNEEEKETVSS
jgi:hypothetical protein